MPQFEALHAQVVGVSADAPGTLGAFAKENNISKQLLAADWPQREMLQKYDAMVTDEKSPIYRYAKRAYFILDKNGTVKYIKVMENPRDILTAEEVLEAVKKATS